MPPRNDDRASPWLVAARPRAEPPARLVCIPYAGGGLAAFGGWAAAMEPGVDLRLASLPGRGRRLSEPPVADLRAIAHALAEAIAALDRSPLVLFGHSMGALIAYEVARELRRTEHAPESLVVAACAAPHLRHRTASLEELPLEEALRALGVGELPADPELRELMVPAFRADLTAVARYRPEPDAPLDCPILALAGTRDPVVGRADVEAWAACTTQGFALREIDGEHLFLDAARDEVAGCVRRAATAPS